MTSRLPTDQRRDQIVAATLALLARLPVDQITTRLIAAEVGISQPALFRHLASRADIIAAVVAFNRDALREGADRVLETTVGWSQTCEALGELLIAHVDRYPGLPRLFFYDLSASGSVAHASLTGLLQMQARLVAQLVVAGQEVSEIPAKVDADAAGYLFVAVMQGAFAASISDPQGQRTARAAVQMWVAGVRAGVPIGDAAVSEQPPWEVLLALDVRPLLARGDEPLDAILAAVSRLAPTGVLVVTAPFRPGPLITLLQRRGLAVEATEAGLGHWEVEVLAAGVPAPLDLRDLEAPEPMEAVLMATGALAPEGVMVARLPRVPRLLFPHLERRGLSWEVHERADGTALLHVRRPS